MQVGVNFLNQSNVCLVESLVDSGKENDLQVAEECVVFVIVFWSAGSVQGNVVVCDLLSINQSLSGEVLYYRWKSWTSYPSIPVHLGQNLFGVIEISVDKGFKFVFKGFIVD